MSSDDAKTLIETAIRRFLEEVPALAPLKLVFAVELRGRGDVQMYRVEMPGPKVTKDIAADAKVRVSVPRSHFNELARDGSLRDWVDAYGRGHVSVSGEAAVIKLVGNVIERQLARAGSR